MVEKLDYSELNSLVKHFLEYNGLKDSVQTFEHEVRLKVLQNQSSMEEASKRRSSSKSKKDTNLLNVLAVNKVPASEEELE